MLKENLALNTEKDQSISIFSVFSFVHEWRLKLTNCKKIMPKRNSTIFEIFFSSYLFFSTPFEKQFSIIILWIPMCIFQYKLSHLKSWDKSFPFAQMAKACTTAIEYLIESRYSQLLYPVSHRHFADHETKLPITHLFTNFTNLIKNVEKARRDRSKSPLKFKNAIFCPLH